MVDADIHVNKVQPQLPFLTRLSNGCQAYSISSLVKTVDVVSAWTSYISSSPYKPDSTKSYETRPKLPISIFKPANHAADSSSKPLPTLFTIHGGGFVIGTPAHDDKWNRMFADTHSVLVIALNYSKAPASPFPCGIHDLEALITSILADPSLPIDKSRCAIAGFSAGGNLALAVAQLPSIRAAFKQYDSAGFSAVVPVYPSVDRTLTRDFKATLRHYKPDLPPYRNSQKDILIKSGKLGDWAYVSTGHSLTDPLISPIYAPKETLPPYVFMIGCELDMLGHESWRMACRLAGKAEPSVEDQVGRQQCGTTGELEMNDERFAWEVVDKEKSSAVRWLLIPDVVHGFDRMPPLLLGDATSVKDAEEKNKKVIAEIGEWLKTRVWI